VLYDLLGMIVVFFRNITVTAVMQNGFLENRSLSISMMTVTKNGQWDIFMFSFTF